MILDKTLEEIGIALEELLTEKIQNYNMGDYPELFEAFGRTQQYISFII